MITHNLIHFDLESTHEKCGVFKKKKSLFIFYKIGPIYS